MGLVEDELECAHSILKLVALECLRLDLVDAMQDLLEAILQVVYALAIYLLDFLALFNELWSIVTRDFLYGECRLMYQGLNSHLQILQLLLLLFGDAEADQFVETGFHEVIHACH